ncbi:MAG: metallophosphatase domain-containing protein [Blastocatellia bacterium]
MRLVSHARHRQLELPKGDILIHAGDISRHGELKTIADFNEWLKELDYKAKIVIAGNHDFCFEQMKGQDLLSNAIYLQDKSVTISGIKVYGSPWQPRFFDWAFNLDRGEPLRQKWNMIAPNTDILITHGPPANICDMTMAGELAGCQDLLEAVEKVKPKLHVFGHIHEAYGVFRTKDTTFVNASSCDVGYRSINPPIVFELFKQLNMLEIKNIQ